MHAKYYCRYLAITKNPFWKMHLRREYRRGIYNLKKKANDAKFSRKGFTALLCGTSGEITSLEFAKFLFSRNRNARLIVLDISPFPLYQSRKTLSEHFPGKPIQYIRCDAKKTKIRTGWVDYIETDCFLQFFSRKDLEILFKEWKRILRDDGAIVTRDFASSTLFGKCADQVRWFIGKYFLKVELHVHTLGEITKTAKKSGLVLIFQEVTWCPTLRRFGMKKGKKS